MNKTALKITLFIIGIMFWTGGACPSNETTASNKVAQSEIYQSYSIDESGGEYEVTAYFRIGGKTGTTLALSAPSKVTFNSRAMQEHLNTTSGTFYTVKVPSSTSSGTFAFTDRNSKTYTNTIDLSRVNLATKQLRTNSSTELPVQLSGPTPSTANFTVEVNGHMTFLGPRRDASTQAYWDEAANTIVLLPAAWKDVPAGNVQIDLEVRNNIPTQQGTALGGEITFVYNSQPATVALTKSKAKPASPPANHTAAVNLPAKK